MYVILVLLALRNIWSILIKQREYKNLPILAFYVFALFAVTFRPVFILGYWTGKPIYPNIDWVQQVAKLCVGVVQDWITLELAIRIHNARGYSDISETAKRKLRFIFQILFASLLLVLTAWSISVIASAYKQKDGYAFDGENFCLILGIISYCFLCQFIVMILLVAWLFIETQRAVDREKRTLKGGNV